MAIAPGVARPAAVDTFVAPSVRASCWVICYTFHVVSSISYKFRFYPDAKQRQQLAVDFGVARFAWNAALDARSFCYRALGRSVSGVDCSRAITELKADPAYVWLKDANSTVITQVLRDQDRAFAHFYAKRAGYPKFKKKHGPQSVRYQLDQRQIGRTFDAKAQWLKLPKLGALKLRWSREVAGIPKMATISRDACGRYFVAFGCEVEIAPLPAKTNAIGIDYGVKDIVVTSDGWKSGNPKPLYRKARKLKAAQRRLSRKTKGSNRRKAQQKRVARLHARVADARQDTLHQLSWALIRDHQAICLQPHNVKGMMANHTLARAIGDVGLGELTRQLRYKAAWYGRDLFEISQWTRTTGTCPACGLIGPKLSLSTRHWRCHCGAVHDRDTASAQVIQRVALGEGQLMRVEAGRSCLLAA
ncbi:MAG: transposase, partial [Candidatus Competibacter denitrificans]